MTGVPLTNPHEGHWVRRIDPRLRHPPDADYWCCQCHLFFHSWGESARDRKRRERRELSHWIYHYRGRSERCRREMDGWLYAHAGTVYLPNIPLATLGACRDALSIPRNERIAP